MQFFVKIWLNNSLVPPLELATLWKILRLSLHCVLTYQVDINHFTPVFFHEYTGDITNRRNFAEHLLHLIIAIYRTVL